MSFPSARWAQNSRIVSKTSQVPCRVFLESGFPQTFGLVNTRMVGHTSRACRRWGVAILETPNPLASCVTARILCEWRYDESYLIISAQEYREEAQLNVHSIFQIPSSNISHDAGLSARIGKIPLPELTLIWVNINEPNDRSRAPRHLELNSQHPPVHRTRHQ